MKKILKIAAMIILILVLLIAGIVFLIFRTLKNELGEQWEAYAKVFTMQTEASKDLPPLDNVVQRTVDIQFICKEGTVESRPIRLYIPEDILQPMPLIYVPHYEMAENSAELRRYLEKGWAVASPAEFRVEYNGQLTDDDLVFNNAALYALRHMEEFDTQRIALVGGSAGGYTTLMLSALQMGNCTSIATAPIANIYFNFYQYFQMANREDAPFFLRLVKDSFVSILQNFPDPENIERWEAFSAVGLADCFNSPLVISHVTSDILVPVDQITREFTYAQEGESMPESFSTRLDHNNPGVLGVSLADELPKELTHVEHIVIDNPDEDTAFPFNENKLFNLLIYDDGPTQAYGSHRATAGTGMIDDTIYLEKMFERTLAQNEILTSRKILLLLERFMGESIQLPAHIGVDDSVYGSLAVYKQEIVEAFCCWATNHSVEELEDAVIEAIEEIDDIDMRDRFRGAWKEIFNEMQGVP